MTFYPRPYWRDCFSSQIGNKDFVEGVIAALFTYGIWKDGVQVIGTLQTPIKDIIEEVQAQLLPEKEIPNG